MIEIYTDGACLGNPGPGGWAWVRADGAHGSGGESPTTNQRMELTAVIEALSANPGGVVIVSDSTYVINCFKDRWWQKWQRTGWRNSKGEPVANADLWRRLIPLVTEREPEVTFRWVKGHAGTPLNEAADQLAQQEARLLR
ncbi:MAG: ribonuclease H family protein [Acidimicrobiales bacterium]